MSELVCQSSEYELKSVMVYKIESMILFTCVYMKSCIALFVPRELFELMLELPSLSRSIKES